MDRSEQVKIRDATHKAQDKFLRLDRSGDIALKRAYRIAGENIALAIEAANPGDGLVRLEYLIEIKKRIFAALQALAFRRKEIFESSFADAIDMASGLLSSHVDQDVLKGVVDDTLRFVQAFTGNDGLQLSDRLWRVDNGAKEAVSRGIEQSIIQGQSASEAAQSFIQDGQVVPKELRYKAGSAQVRRLSKGAKKYMRGVSYENARRVFRTELNRAYTKAYESSVFEVSDAIGTRFMLSSNHKKRDICDTLANADSFGLGKGVYPEGKNPCPAHPNTTSYIVAVFKNEIE